MPTTDTPGAARKRFALDEIKARAWLDTVFAANDGDPAALDELAEAAYPRIGKDWSSRCNTDNDWNEDLAPNAFCLVRGAVETGAILRPEGADLNFTDGDGGYHAEVTLKIHPGRALTVHSYGEDITKLGDGDLRGADAAIVVLHEIVDMGNSALNDLAAYIATQKG